MTFYAGRRGLNFACHGPHEILGISLVTWLFQDEGAIFFSSIGMTSYQVLEIQSQ